jgi:predicted phosphodiesterase
MRVAVFSDIHGNAVALDAVLADIAACGADQLLCLGDAVQGGPQPSDVVRRLRQLGCPVVMGNADAWLLTGEETGAETIDAERLRQMEAMRAWSLTQLSAEDRDYIAAFQPTVELPLADGLTLLGFHGSPASFDDIIVPATPDHEVRRLLEPHLPRILAGGHTHVQQLRQLGPSFYFGCGSVGRAYRHDQEPAPALRYDPWAEYALLSVKQGAIGLELRRVPFDVAALAEVYRASGCPFAAQAAAQYTWALR